MTASGAASRRALAALAAASVGTVIEWYDFLVYATAATLLFPKLFFPAADAGTALLASIGTFAVGFFARPLGGLVFGRRGDRFGRRATLVGSLALMGASTFAIGLLPTYGAAGPLAPALLVLLRVLQGIGLGGEWGGAAALVAEHAPSGRRGLYGSLLQAGFPLGLVLSTAAVSAVSRLPADALLAYGWRLPFLASGVLFAVGLYVRLRVAESPVFLTLEREPPRPAENSTALRRSFLVAVGLKVTETAWVYILTVFLVVYATGTLHLGKPLLLDLLFYAALSELLTIPLFGWLSDRLGRRPFFIAGALFTVLWAFPVFFLVGTRSPALVGLAIAAAMTFGHALMFSLEATVLPELFPGRARCVGASLGFQVAAAIGGGLVPLAATALLRLSGGTAAVSALMVALAALTLAAALAAPETAGEVLEG